MEVRAPVFGAGLSPDWLILRTFLTSRVEAAVLLVSLISLPFVVFSPFQTIFRNSVVRQVGRFMISSLLLVAFSEDAIPLIFRSFLFPTSKFFLRLGIFFFLIKF